MTTSTQVGIFPLTAKLAARSGSVEIAGSEASIQSEDPQEVLYRLLSWAEREGRKLEALEVSRPSLEDVYLELTAPEEAESE